MKILTKKEVEKLRNALVANYIIAEDALFKASMARCIDDDEFHNALDKLVDNTLCSATILKVQDNIVKTVFAYHELRTKQMQEEENEST